MRLLYLIYQYVSYLRRKIYEKNILKKKKLKKPVISVGNITFGGSGKTPFVIRLTKELIDKGLRVSILSRGYKRKSKGLVPVSDGKQMLVSLEEAGDEPFLIAKSIPKAIVTVCEDRFLAGKFAEEENEIDIHILDDGFQHYKLARNFDIVLLKNDEDLVKKKQREPLIALKKASYVFLINNFSREIKNFLELNFIPHSKIEFLNYGFFSQDDKVIDLNWVRENEWIALAGIKAPEKFFKDLENLSIKVKKFIPYPDHFFPSNEEILKIEKIVKENKVKGIICTQKDVYKWRGDFEIIYHKIGFPPLDLKFLEKIIKIYEKKYKI